MTLRNLCVELWPKMRLGSIMLILRPKSNGSTLAHPLLRNVRVSSAGKVMTSIFWDSQGIIMVDYLEEDRMINGAYYAKELSLLSQDIENKRRGKLTQGVLLLQDNAPTHTLQVAMAAATKCSFQILPHSPYSQDSVLLDFYLFPNLKTNLHGRYFGSNEGIIDAVDEYLGDQEGGSWSFPKYRGWELFDHPLYITVEPQWLEHLWDHRNSFETWVVWATKG